jgi:hypothetical protein
MMTEDQWADYDKQVKAAAARGDQYPPAWERNGFEGLRYWDATWRGGNGDGKITPTDQIWPKLRLWVNTTHDAVWPNGEVLTLDQAGITEISLTYSRDTRFDQYGNQYRFRGSVKTISDHAPQVWDVFLVTPKSSTN